MLKNVLKVSAVLTGVLGFATAANATITAVGSLGGAATGVTFVNFDAGTSPATACPIIPATSVTVAFSGAGTGFHSGTLANNWAEPFLSGGNGNNFGPSPACGNQGNGADGTTYIATLTGGTTTITLPGSEQYLGLLWGSIDPFNSLTFMNGATVVKTFTGTDILAGANGDEGVNGTLYVNFNASDIGSAFTSIVMTSSGNSFEVDNLAFNPTPIVKTPEPLTLGLFGAGLAGLGFARRRKARKA